VSHLAGAVLVGKFAYSSVYPQRLWITWWIRCAQVVPIRMGTELRFIWREVGQDEITPRINKLKYI
jgi:hypothetical protein